MSRYFDSIVDVEEVVGKKAVDILVRQRDIVLTFGGGHVTDKYGKQSPAADIAWRIPR